MVPQGMNVHLPLTVGVLRDYFVHALMVPCGSQGHLAIICALQLCNFHEYVLVLEALECVSIGSEMLHLEKWIYLLLVLQSRFPSSC